MSAKKTVLVCGLALCALSLAMVWVPPLRPLQAQSMSEQRWCNTYLDARWLPGSDSQLRIKYGKKLMVEQYDSSDAWKWWFDIITAPDDARNKKMMYFYAISEITIESLAEISNQISSAAGQEKPLFAMAVDPRVLDQWGIKLSSRAKTSLLAAPVWWNSDLATTMNTAMDVYSVDPAKAKGSLAHLVSYTVASSVEYDPDPLMCNPAHSPNMDHSKFTADIMALKGTYVGTSLPIESLKATATLVVMIKGDWPTED